MALNWRCFLDDIQVEEPTNLSDIEMSIVRDDDLHGIGFEATAEALNFIGDAAAYLESKKNTEGLKAAVVFRLEENCGDDTGDWDVVLEGKVNMGQYKKSCGDSCTVSVPIESTTCETVMMNRYDQSVDIDNPFSFDGVTALPGYFNLGIDMDLPTRELEYLTYGIVADEGDVEPVEFGDPGGGDAFVLVRPAYANEQASNISDSQLTGGTTVGYQTGSPIIFIPPSPQVLYDEPRQECFQQTFKVNGRLAGTISLPGNSNVILNFVLKRGEINPAAILDPATDVRHLYSQGPYTNPVNMPFDWSFTEYDWNPINNGSDGLYLMLIIFQDNGQVFNGNVTFDNRSFFKAETKKTCPPTKTKAYMVHETLSRVTEAITDYCVRVKSSYYGRTDSQPFDFPTDGCGGLRFLTSGLKIRNAANPTFFASLRTLIEGLQNIDNIGMGIEPDPDKMNQLLLRVEDLDYFYQNREILKCDFINKGDETIDVTKSYAQVNVGYKKWETQANFGLDEFNSNRQYRTALTAISTALDITSGLVTGEYPIELTREQQYVDTSDADTTYDNETFLICLRRMAAAGYPYGEMVVEQGNVASPENIFSPSSIYNYGISPIRNLMRWFRSIAAGYPNLTDSDNRLYFNAGTGNLLAKGELSAIYGGTCRLENQPIQENQDISATIFEDQTKATPLWRNEIFSYQYPMSLADYKRIKADPYGYISYQCGNGTWEKGWIKALSYKPESSMGTFTLKKKWQ